MDIGFFEFIGIRFFKFMDIGFFLNLWILDSKMFMDL